MVWATLTAAQCGQEHSRPDAGSADRDGGRRLGDASSPPTSPPLAGTTADAADDDAGTAPTERGESVLERLLAPDCSHLAMTPESASTLGWQLLLCGQNTLSRVELKTATVTVLTDLQRSNAPLDVHVTRDRVLLNESGAFRSIGFSGDPDVTVASRELRALAGDQQRVVVSLSDGSLSAMSANGTGPELALLPKAAPLDNLYGLDAKGRRLLCTRDMRLLSVDIQTGHRLDLAPARALLDAPRSMAAWLSEEEESVHLVGTDGGDARQWPREPGASYTLRYFGWGSETLVLRSGAERAALSLRSGRWTMLATPSDGDIVVERAAPRALLLQTAPNPDPQHWTKQTVTLQLIPLNGEPAISIGMLDSNYWVDYRDWVEPVRYSADMRAALALDETGRWLLADLDDLTVSTLHTHSNNTFYGPSAISPDGQVLVYHDCDSDPARSECTAFVTDREGHVRQQVAITSGFDVRFAPDSRHFVLTHSDGRFEVAGLDQVLGRFTGSRSNGVQGGPHITWIDARRLVYDRQGVYLLELGER